MKRPDCIRHWRDVEGADDSTYPDSTERFSIGAPLARKLGLGRIGIHHERLPPGRRTSYPHAESDEEEFIYVLEGYPEAWINGYLWKLEPGDSVGFRPEPGCAIPLSTIRMKRSGCWSLAKPTKSTTASIIR
jgi:uncharacterized cupin superfamily protein